MTDHPTEEQTEEQVVRDESGAMVAAISREVVGVYSEYYGRGPTKAKTVWREDVVTCVLEDAFTRAERVLVDGGRFEQVRVNRQAFQDAIEPLLREALEKVTGRRVDSCLSQINDKGVAIEVFVLGPHVASSR
jgi:uncharacterized protein YbcI